MYNAFKKVYFLTINVYKTIIYNNENEDEVRKMKNSKIFLFFGISVFGITATLVASQITGSKNFLNYPSRAQAGEYTLILNSAPTGLTEDYQNLVASDIQTTNGNDVELSFSNAKALNNGFVQLANHGKIYNFNDSNEQLTGINGVQFTGSGSFIFKPAVAKGRLMDITPITVSAGSSKVSVPSCDYFEIEAGDSGASISSLTFSYSCDSNAYDIESLNGTYTGVGDDSYIYKLTINDGAVTLASLDKASNTSVNGTASMSSKTNVSLTFPSLSYVLTYNGHSLAFVSKSGTGAEISFDRVYTVENFQSYTTTGTGYVSSAAKYTTTGLRSQYYADYYTGSSSGEIGGSGWPIMTSTDNSNYNSSKGHNGSKTGIFKFSNSLSMRYISMNSLFGVKRIIGKGATLSLWARGAYTNTSFNVDHASNIDMKVYAYYDSPLTPSNQTTVRESFDFTVTSGSSWQHFEFSLTNNREYYGFGIYAQQKSGSTMYVPIDDVEIYTASPYAEYVAPVAVTGVSVSPTELDLEPGDVSNLTATVAPNDATNKNVTWVSSNTSVATVDNNGQVIAVADGNATITVTTVDGSYIATCAVTVTSAHAPYPSGSYQGSAIVSGNTFTIVIAFGTRANGLIAVRLANQDAVATGVTYNDANQQFTITTTGDYSGMKYGNITGTYDDLNNRLTNISCSGSIKSYVSNNGSITATQDFTVYENCDGTTSELQSLFKRRYMSGSWQVDASNADRITSNTTEYVSGTGSVKRRGYSGGAVALNFNSDFATAKTVANVQFWVYNPSASDITLRMWGYKAKGFGSNFETGSVKAIAGQWTYLAMGFTSAAIYNWQIADFNNTGVYLSFDNIALF